MSATLPCRSGTAASVDGRDDLVHRRGPALGGGNPPLPAHAVHRAGGAVSVVLQCRVGAGDRPPGGRKERGGEPHLPHVAVGAVPTPPVYTERLGGGVVRMCD